MNKYTNVSKFILHLKHNMTQKHEHNTNTRINKFRRDIIFNRHIMIKKKSEYETFYLIKIS